MSNRYIGGAEWEYRGSGRSVSKLNTGSAEAIDYSLPTSGITGTQCFYNCKSLVGGNGTVWTSNNTSYTFMQIDRAGQLGYLTAG